jgi:hypothetical protein
MFDSLAGAVKDTHLTAMQSYETFLRTEFNLSVEFSTITPSVETPLQKVTETTCGLWVLHKVRSQCSDVCVVN